MEDNTELFASLENPNLRLIRYKNYLRDNHRNKRQ